MDWIGYVTIAILFMGLNSFIVKVVLKKVSPYIVLFYQYLLAVPLVAFYALILGNDFSSGSPLMISLGVIYFFALSFYYISMSKGNLSKAAPVFNLKMIVTAILGIIFLSEPLSLQLIIGLLLGGLSVYLLGGK